MKNGQFMLRRYVATEDSRASFLGARGCDSGSGWERVGRGSSVVDANLKGSERSRYSSRDMVPWVCGDERWRARVLLGDGGSGGGGCECSAAMVFVESWICDA